MRASVTKRKERSFRQAIERFDARGSEAADVHPRIRQAERQAMESQLDDSRAELAAYERLKAAGPNEHCAVPGLPERSKVDAGEADGYGRVALPKALLASFPGVDCFNATEDGLLV